MLRLVLIASLLVASYGKLVPGRLLHTGGRIVGGVDAKIEDVPYQAGILYGDMFICGGSILSEKVVITAAHCAEWNPKYYRVFVGTNKIPKLISQENSQVVDVEKVVIHPDYATNNELIPDYDAALFILTAPLKIGPTASPVSLPAQDQKVADDAPAITSGWGHKKEGGAISDVLQKVTIPIVNQEKCNKLYEGRITPRMICAGLVDEGGKDACQGDSGGPLVVDGKLMGITSWGKGCARPKFPGVWARVPAISKWIKDQLALYR